MASKPGPYGKANLADARAFLAGIPEFTQHSKLGAGGINSADAIRLSNQFARQIGAGLTPNYQAARGHAFTPEHPTSRPPRLPEPAARYAPPSDSKYGRRVTGQTGAPTRHRRTRGRSHIPFSDDGEIYTRNTEREARGVLAYADAIPPAGSKHIVMQVYDCTVAGANNGWFPVLSHTWNAGGIDMYTFMEWWRQSGQSLTEFVKGLINGNGARGDSDATRHGGITHICQWEITILPSATILRRRA